MAEWATGTNEAQTTNAGTQDKRTQGERANNGVCAEAVPPCARQMGVSRERKAAHNSPRRGAWGVVFVGVFACVCRLFWAGGFWVFGCFFGVFGVFFGFLIFLCCCGCGLFEFVLVCFGWGLLCLVLIVFAVLTRLLIL